MDQPQSSGQAAKQKILVVEDDAKIARVLQLELEHEGFEVELCGDGASAIERPLSHADLDVTDTELRITLAPQSSPHRTRAIAALCEDLNRTPTRFPGTRLTLRFAIHQPAADPGG